MTNTNNNDINTALSTLKAKHTAWLYRELDLMARVEEAARAIGQELTTDGARRSCRTLDCFDAYTAEV